MCTSMVGRGLVAVAHEEDWDRRALAEVDGGEEVGEDGFGHGRKVVLDIDDEECDGLAIWVLHSNLVFLVG